MKAPSQFGDNVMYLGIVDGFMITYSNSRDDDKLGRHLGRTTAALTNDERGERKIQYFTMAMQDSIGKHNLILSPGNNHVFSELSVGIRLMEHGKSLNHSEKTVDGEAYSIHDFQPSVLARAFVRLQQGKAIYLELPARRHPNQTAVILLRLIKRRVHVYAFIDSKIPASV